jgi:hypothetical protein
MMMMNFFTEKYTHLSEYLLVGQTVPVKNCTAILFF